MKKVRKLIEISESAYNRIREYEGRTIRCGNKKCEFLDSVLNGESILTNNASLVNWIPVSERLPKTTEFHKDFLVSVYCEAWSPFTTKTMVATWENTTIRGKKVSRWLWKDRLFPDYWKIIGWAELPEPMH